MNIKPMGLPLKGLRVVDLTKDFAGPFCTMILSDLGADVVKVERPRIGDETRSWGPPFVNGQSYYFLSLNRGKNSIVLDVKKRKAQEILQKLVVDSDILVESFRPGSLKKLGLGYQTLQRKNKALVYCSISGFGQTGPYKKLLGYDLVAFAMSGIMSTTGEKGRPPIRVSVPVADIAAGHFASTAILAALSRRLVTGQGDYIDISLLDSIVSWLTYNAAYYFATGKQPERFGSAHPSIVPYQAFQCSDGFLVVAVGNDQQWRELCNAIELPRMQDDRRFSTNPLRVRNRGSLIPVLSTKFRTRTVQHWCTVLRGKGVPSAPVYDVSRVVRDPQLAARGMITRGRSGFPQLRSPMRFSSQNRGWRRAPVLGDSTNKVLRDLGYSRKAMERLRMEGVIA
jgi:crotonobetainyl-CoA:carnitine CoA-transferase CaiB-like acyl-CoA transferase